MKQSIFHVFKLSLGPSSSHTTGPMTAAQDFIQKLNQRKKLSHVGKIDVILYGSLAATGIGHCTDKAILLGLHGMNAEIITLEDIKKIETYYSREKKIKLLGSHVIPFSLNKNLIFKAEENLPYHPNSLKFIAYDSKENIIRKEIFYSIGGGLILSEHDQNKTENESPVKVPYPFDTFKELYFHGRDNDLSLAEIALANEKYFRSSHEVYQRIDQIIQAMEESILRGSKTKGILPGPQKVRRKAPAFFNKLAEQEKLHHDPLSILDWVNLYALAVNEENASGSKIVTAPTNGAAGIIPAVFSYYKKHTKNPTSKGYYDFFLTAGTIGLLYMKKSSISGAEVGCQGEVGVACSMAAAGLAAALGASNLQIEKAAEIGMEHNLGLTCDPISGLVQIPCIERNAMASVKAINASRIALVCHNKNYVSLDEVIKTMHQTGLDMQNKYKETSAGGLAVNVRDC